MSDPGVAVAQIPRPCDSVRVGIENLTKYENRMKILIFTSNRMLYSKVLNYTIGYKECQTKNCHRVCVEGWKDGRMEEGRMEGWNCLKSAQSASSVIIRDSDS